MYKYTLLFIYKYYIHSVHRYFSRSFLDIPVIMFELQVKHFIYSFGVNISL